MQKIGILGVLFAFIGVALAEVPAEPKTQSRVDPRCAQVEQLNLRDVQLCLEQVRGESGMCSDARSTTCRYRWHAAGYSPAYRGLMQAQETKRRVCDARDRIQRELSLVTLPPDGMDPAVREALEDDQAAKTTELQEFEVACGEADNDIAAWERYKTALETIEPKLVARYYELAEPITESDLRLATQRCSQHLATQGNVMTLEERAEGKLACDDHEAWIKGEREEKRLAAERAARYRHY